MDGKHFYKKIKPFKTPVTEVLKQKQFYDVPADWHIIIADVKNSTSAVAAGRHNDVNLVAGGCLIAALNIAKAHQIEIPFFFGGDGGTCIVPAEILPQVINALVAHNQNSKKNLNLEMHIGSIEVQKVLDAGHFLQITKVQINKGFAKPIAIGGGLRYAEEQIKLNDFDEATINQLTTDLNLTGLECRWDKIKPPVEENEVVCFLVEATNPKQQPEVFYKTLNKIEELYGSMEKRNPLSAERLKLLLSFRKIKKEMMARYGKWKTNYFTATLLKTFLGSLLFKYNLKFGNFNAKLYLAQVVSNAETLTIDGRLNTILTGKAEKRQQLHAYLRMQEEAGELVFGHHISKETIMTCYIENMNEKHIHFIDGNNGGFTEAAKELKKKLKLF